MNERTPKLLVVDDDPRLRDLLRRYLGENGFQVYVADNGVTMNRLWLRERFDALILDLMMPGEDGLQILRRLREQKDTTPIFMQYCVVVLLPMLRELRRWKMKWLSSVSLNSI